MPVLFLTDLTDVKIVNQNRRKIAKMEPCILKNWELFDLKNLTLKQIFATFAILNLTYLYNRTYSFKHQNIMFKTKIQRIKKNFEALILGVFSIIFKEINLLFVIIPLRSKVDGRDYLY